MVLIFFRAELPIEIDLCALNTSWLGQMSNSVHQLLRERQLLIHPTYLRSESTERLDRQ
jgi:hypothetical protein